MRLEQYKLEFNATKTSFDFISEGPQGHILKRVEYVKIKSKVFKNLYNLAFGDVIPDSDDIDDEVITDNQDRDKVLATVVQTMLIFTEHRPKAKIFMTGSTDVRTRLYRMAISKYFDEIHDIFEVNGYMNKKWLPFEKNMPFEAFLINLKIS